MAQDYFYLSNFGVRYLLSDFVNTDTIPQTLNVDNELQGLVSCTLGEINKEVTKKRTLNGNGWEVAAVLGNSQGDGTFEAVRLGTGNAYVGAAGTDTYTKLRHWFMEATKDAGRGSPKVVTEIIPRGDVYEGTVYYVIPTNWGPGSKDTENGQEYSFTVTPFGPPVPVKVTHTPASGDNAESWTIEKASA